MNRLPKDTATKIEAIFREGHVVDLDFSEWDRRVRMIVVGQKLPITAAEAYQLYRIDFRDVLDFRWQSNHIGIELESEFDHCQWTTMKSELKEVDSTLVITVSDLAPPSPKVTIRCLDIVVSTIGREVLDSANPDWNRAGAPLARPSLDVLYGLRRRTKAERQARRRR